MNKRKRSINLEIVIWASRQQYPKYWILFLVISPQLNPLENLDVLMEGFSINLCPPYGQQNVGSFKVVVVVILLLLLLSFWGGCKLKTFRKFSLDMERTISRILDSFVFGYVVVFPQSSPSKVQMFGWMGLASTHATLLYNTRLILGIQGSIERFKGLNMGRTSMWKGPKILCNGKFLFL